MLRTDSPARTRSAPPPAACRADPALLLLNGLPDRPDPDQVRRAVDSLPINDRLPGQPKDPDTSPLFRLYADLADPVRTETMRLRFLSGISWEDARAALTALILRTLDGR